MPYNTSGVKLAAPVMPHCVARLSVENVDVGMTGGDEPKKRFLVQVRVVEPPPELADYTGHTFSTNYVVGMVLRYKDGPNEGELITNENGEPACNDPDANESETWEHPKNFAARRWWGLMAGCGADPTGDEQADADAIAGSEFMGEVRVNPSRTDQNGNTYDPRNDLGQVFAPGDRNAELKVIKDKGAKGGGARPAQRSQQAPQRSANGPAAAPPAGPSYKCVQCGKVVVESMRQQHVIAHKKAAQTSAQAPAATPPQQATRGQVVTPGKATGATAVRQGQVVKRNPAPPPPPEEAMEEAMGEGNDEEVPY